MNQLYPIIRRQRKPLIEAAPPAPTSVTLDSTVPPAPPRDVPAGGRPQGPEKITLPDDAKNAATTEPQ